jgi:hypothetical protein
VAGTEAIEEATETINVMVVKTSVGKEMIDLSVTTEMTKLPRMTRASNNPNTERPLLDA